MKAIKKANIIATVSSTESPNIFLPSYHLNMDGNMASKADDKKEKMKID